MRCRLRNLFEVQRRNARTTCFLRRPSHRSPGRIDDRAPGVEELRTEAARATAVVGRVGSIRSLHDIRHHLQRHESLGGYRIDGESGRRSP